MNTKPKTSKSEAGILDFKESGKIKVIRDPNINPNAKVVLLYLLSHKKTFKPNMAGIRFNCKLGKQAAQTAIKELETLGYLTRQRIRDEKTKTFTYFYNASVFTTITATQTTEPQPGSRTPASRTTGSRTPATRLYKLDQESINTTPYYPPEEKLLGNGEEVVKEEKIINFHTGQPEEKKEIPKPTTLTIFETEEKELPVNFNQAQTKILNRLISWKPSNPEWKEKIKNLLINHPVSLINDWIDAMPYYPQEIRSKTWYFENCLNTGEQLPVEYRKEKSKQIKRELLKNWSDVLTAYGLQRPSESTIEDRVAEFVAMVYTDLTFLKSVNFESRFDSEVQKQQAYIKKYLDNILFVKSEVRDYQDLAEIVLNTQGIRSRDRKLFTMPETEYEKVVSQFSMIRYHAEKLATVVMEEV